MITFELFWSLLFHLALTEHHLQIWKGKSTKTFLEAENFAEVQEVILQKVIFFRKQPSLTNIQPDKQSCSSSWNPGHKSSSSQKLRWFVTGAQTRVRLRAYTQKCLRSGTEKDDGDINQKYEWEKNLLSQDHVITRCYLMSYYTLKYQQPVQVTAIMKPPSCWCLGLERICKPGVLEAFLRTWAIFVFFCWNLQRRNIRVPDWSLNCSWKGCSSWTVSPKL